MKLKYALVFLVSLLAFGVNSGDSVLTRMGFDRSYLFAAVIAAVITWLVARKHILFILAILVMVTGVNAPAEFAEHAGYDRDYLLAALIAVVIIPSSFDKRAQY